MEYINRNPKIYIISGKAKSGKNTVSKIINDYYKDKKCIELAYAYYLKNYVKNISNWNGSEETKPRDLLQSIGIDLIKNRIDKRFLINRVIQDIKVYSYFFDIIIITDARLIEEIEIPKNTFDKVITIRVDNDGYNDLTLAQKNHITETGLDEFKNFDYIINNHNNYEELKREVIKVLEDTYEK